jgi:hypothetical protein
VAIDIKPGGFPNRLHPKSHGIIPVAILTTPAVDGIPARGPLLYPA